MPHCQTMALNELRTPINQLLRLKMASFITSMNDETEYSGHVSNTRVVSLLDYLVHGWGLKPYEDRNCLKILALSATPPTPLNTDCQ